MTKVKKVGPKARKYHYNFNFKRGNYFSVSHELEEKFPRLFSGSGLCLSNGAFDVGFICTAADARKIRRHITRNHPRAKVTRSEP
jgi:hypothetical protein